MMPQPPLFTGSILTFRKTWWMWLLFPFCRTTIAREGDFVVVAKWWRGTCYILKAGKG